MPLLALLALFLMDRPQAPGATMSPARPGSVYCLPRGQAALAGLHLDTPEATILRRLGQPHERRITTGVDDGGEYQVIELLYSGLLIDLGRGRTVERLLTSSPGPTTPAGVRVGQTLTEVVRRLGAPESLEELEEVTWSPPLCDDGPLDVVAAVPEITFTWTLVPGPFDTRRPLEQVRKLAQIELTRSGP